MALSGSDAGLGEPRRPGAERPILFACALIGVALGLLLVAERLGAGGMALAVIAVALPLVAMGVLAFVGRTIDRAPFLTAGGAGAMTCGLALGAEWMGAGVVPFVLLAPSTALALGGAFGLFAFVVALAGALRRAGSLTIADFLGRRLASRTVRWVTALISMAALAGLMAFQIVLMRTLLLALVGEAAGLVLAAMTALAAVVLVLGGQRSLTLVNAFLGFFLGLAFIVPAFAALFGLPGLTGPLPVDRAFALLLPAGPDTVLFASAALAMLGSPLLASRTSAVRGGGLFGAGAWALLAGYVTMAAAAVAYTPGDATTSIAETLPTLGWLGAVWSGFTIALFALATHAGHDLGRARGDHDRGWGRRASGGAMALTRLVGVAGAGVAWLAASRGWIDETAGALGLLWWLGLLAGTVAPALVACVWWRRVSRIGVLASQAVGLGLTLALLLPASPLRLGTVLPTGWIGALAFAAALGVLVAVGLLVPRRRRPDPALMRVVRRPER